MDISLLNIIPTDPGIYLFKDKKGEILYIGKAKNLHKRVAQYFNPNSLWKQDMLANAHTVDFLIVKTESEALYLEDNLIKKHKPRYNNLLKADNSYIYIKITKEEFPQIILTRKKIKDGSIYIGPKHNTMELKKFMQYIRQVLQFRGCKATQFRQGKLCSDYHFGLCKGRCKEGNKSDYKKIIEQIISFFKGNTGPIEKEIKNQIADSIQKQNFERAARLRDIYLHIQQLVEKQTVVIQTPVTGYIFKIKNIGNFLIYCVVNFYEGKLIDVIRGKESTEDLDINALKSSLEIEFGDFEILNKSKTEMLGITDKAKKPKKSDLAEIDLVIEKFFDSFIMSTTFEKENLNNDILGELQSRYGLRNFPYRIECIDISHLSGGRVSGGLSCLLGGLRNFKGYRKYKIKSLVKGKSDDYASLSELLLRRFTNEKTIPDMLVIDGGKGQLGVVKKLYKENEIFHEIFDHVDFVGLGKGEARNKINIGKTSKKSEKISEKLYYFDENMNIKSKDLIYDQTDKILTSIRDEAHRFANAYRKKQMGKEFS